MDTSPKICSTCTCDIDVDENFIVCSGSSDIHYFHCNCFNHYLTTNSEVTSVIDFWATCDKLLCPNFSSGCTGCVEDVQIYSLDRATINNFVTTTRKIACSVDRRETIAHLEEMAMKNSEESATNFTKRIVNNIIEILTTSICCPHCQTPFGEFDGCLALLCDTCGEDFCGVCLKKHPSIIDVHSQVASHIATFSQEILLKYGFHGSYFIPTKFWPLWCEKLKIDSIVSYLKTLRNDIVWEAFESIKTMLKKNNLITESGIITLGRMVYSHEYDTIHLIRIPVVYWLLLSAKHDITFEDAVSESYLTTDHKMEIGKLVVNAVRKKHPAWNAIKSRAPGANYQVINYPPETLPSVTSVIEDWGRRNKIWG